MSESRTMNKDVKQIVDSNVKFLTSDMNKNKLGEFNKIGVNDVAFNIARQQITFIFSDVKDSSERESQIYDSIQSLIDALTEANVWKNRMRSTFNAKDICNKLFYSHFLPMLEKEVGEMCKLEGTQDYILTDPTTKEESKCNAINWKNLTRLDKKEEKEGKTAMKVVKS